MVRLPMGMRTLSFLCTTSGEISGNTRLLQVHEHKSSIVMDMDMDMDMVVILGVVLPGLMLRR